MQDRFFPLAERLFQDLTADERLLLHIQGEVSDFVRYNQGRIRQAGQAVHSTLTVRLVHGRRHAAYPLTLTGTEDDLPRARAALTELRVILPALPEDPHLQLPESRIDSSHVEPSRLPPPTTMADQVLDVGQGLDLVGIQTSGAVFAGFADSHGQQNWFERSSVHLDASVHEGDRSIKFQVAGFDWQEEDLRASVHNARQQLPTLRRPPKTLAPGGYRALLLPSALGQLVELVGRSGFSLSARERGFSCLRRAYDGESLHPGVTLTEDSAGGLGPTFDAWGFVRPDHTVLYREGRHVDPLVNPRSAKEFGAVSTGANHWEMPESLRMAPGDIPSSEALQKLGTGLLVSNVHYLNYSDQGAARITGLTRFACGWVENGELVAPIDTMRFDDTAFRFLGSELEGLTDEAPLMADGRTYAGRSTTSVRAPGALVADFRLTL